jgi:hypothetical protein
MQEFLQVVRRLRFFLAECHEKMMAGKLSHLTGYAVIATFAAGVIIGILIG